MKKFLTFVTAFVLTLLFVPSSHAIVGEDGYYEGCEADGTVIGAGKIEKTRIYLKHVHMPCYMDEDFQLLVRERRLRFKLLEVEEVYCETSCDICFGYDGYNGYDGYDGYRILEMPPMNYFSQSGYGVGKLNAHNAEIEWYFEDWDGDGIVDWASIYIEDTAGRVIAGEGNIKEGRFELTDEFYPICEIIEE